VFTGTAIRNVLENVRSKNLVSVLVLKDIFYRFWSQYILIGFYSSVTIGLQIIGIAIILSSFNGNLHLPFGLEDRFLLKSMDKEKFIILSFFILSLSSVFMFLARKVIVHLMIEYESLCTKDLMAQILNKRAEMESKSDGEIITLLSKDCRFGGRIVQEISNIVMPVGFSIIAFPLLFYLNYEATLILMVVGAVTVLPYTLIAAKARSISYSFEESAAVDSRFKKEMISNYRKTKGVFETSSLPHPAFKRAYQQRLIVPHYGILFGGIQIAFCLAALALWFVSTETSSIDIAKIILYGFVGVFTLNQLRSVAKVFANFHVFLAYFQRAFIIIKEIDVSRVASLPGKDKVEPDAFEEEL
jgi:ABC-type multidrug transport system fused ATPase/permease subunit